VKILFLLSFDTATYHYTIRCSWQCDPPFLSGQLTEDVESDDTWGYPDI
jgi:hypothetical protein